MFWSKKKDKKTEATLAHDGKGGEKRGNDSKADSSNRSSLIQKLFRNGCDSDFVYYDE